MGESVTGDENLMKQKKIDKKITRKYWGTGRMAIFLIVLSIAVFGMTVVAARYIHSTERSDTAAAKEFYFVSDLLDGNTHEITAFRNSNGDVSGSVTFHLMNHEDELRYSGVNIEYAVTMKEVQGTEGESTEQEINLVDETSGNTEESAITGTGVTGTLSKDGIKDASVTINGLEPGKTYEISATTKNTYEKTLTGRIEVKALDLTVNASINDQKSYIELTVWTADYAGDITIQYCSGLIPDNTNPLMADAKRAGSTDGGQFTVNKNNMGANASHVFRFFRESGSSSKQYEASVAEGTVTINEE